MDMAIDIVVDMDMDMAVVLKMEIEQIGLILSGFERLLELSLVALAMYVLIQYFRKKTRDADPERTRRDSTSSR